MKFTAILFIIALAFAEFPEENNIIVLDDKTFDEGIKEHESLLVLFYAPWCGHCKKLAPEYAAAAAELRALDPPLYLAKVDATANPILSKRFSIKGFPTLKFFKNGAVSDYDSGRTKDDIMAFMKKKSGPVTVTYETKEALETAIEAAEVALVGYFADTESDDYKEFFNAASSLDDVTAIHISNEAVAKAMNVEMPSLYLYKSIDAFVKYDKSQDLKKWVILNELPLIVPFNQKYSKLLFSEEHGIKYQLMFFAPEKNPGELKEVLEKIAGKFMGKLFVVHIPSENKRLLEYFGIENKDIPAIGLGDFSGSNMKKYRLDTSIEKTQENIEQFAQDFLDGKLKPFLKSQEIPTSQTGPVYKVVGKNFEEIVYNPKKNVFVKFFAPWCGHCKALAPVYEEIAKAYQNDPNVLIAEMDATANEVDGINIRGFPTLKFFKAGGDGRQVVDFNGNRDFDSLKKFIDSNTIMVEKPAEGEATVEPTGETNAEAKNEEEL